MRNAADRPETTATVLKFSANRANVSTVPLRGRAALGSSTIADRVPSKSVTMAVEPGWASNGANTLRTDAAGSHGTSLLQPTPG